MKNTKQKKFAIKSIVLCALFSTGAMAEPMGLNSAYQMALAHDAQIAQAQAQFGADNETVNTALGVLLPQVSADANYSVNDGNTDSSDINSKDWSVSLNQPIYNHAGWAGYAQAKQITKAAELSLRKAKQDLILRVSESYFNVLLAQKSLQLSNTKLKSDQTQLETAEASAELGLASQVDVLEARSNFDLSKSDTINAENQLDIALESFANIIGKPVAILKSEGLKVMMSDVVLPYQDLSTKELAAKINDGNLDVMLANNQLEQSQQQIEIKRAGHYPDINFQAQYKETHYLDSHESIDDSHSSRYGINFSLPLYSGGRTTSEVRAAKQTSIVAREALRQSREGALLSMRTQVRNLEQGRKLVNALKEAVKSNDAFLEAAEEGYRVGLRSMLEVLTARTNQTLAQRNLIEAIHNQVLNHLKLEAVLGDLMVEDIQTYEALLELPNS